MSLKQFQVAGMTPASDVDRATRFYTETLGLDLDTSSGEGTHTYASAQNTAPEIYETPSAGKAVHTLAAWFRDSEGNILGLFSPPTAG